MTVDNVQPPDRRNLADSPDYTIFLVSLGMSYPVGPNE